MVTMDTVKSLSTINITTDGHYGVILKLFNILTHNHYGYSKVIISIL